MTDAQQIRELLQQLNTSLQANATPWMGWIQMLVQGGALALLAFLLYKAPAEMRAVREDRRKEEEAAAAERDKERNSSAAEREKERIAAATERDNERKIRHEQANQFHSTVLSIITAFKTEQAADRLAQDHREERQTNRVTEAIGEQTKTLACQMDELNSNLSQVCKASLYNKPQRRDISLQPPSKHPPSPPATNPGNMP